MLRSVGADITSAAILRASRSLHAVQNAGFQFQSETCSAASTHLVYAGRHKKKAIWEILWFLAISSHERKCTSKNISSIIYIFQRVRCGTTLWDD